MTCSDMFSKVLWLRVETGEWGTRVDVGGEKNSKIKGAFESCYWPNESHGLAVSCVLDKL